MSYQSDGIGVVNVDRTSLYEQVWTVPGAQLAVQYGISDVGLAKACKRYRIPRPPRGYWAKIAAGQRVRRMPLPTVKDSSLNTVQMQGWDLPSEAIQEIVTVGPHRTSPPSEPKALSHPLAVLALEQLTVAKPGHDGRVHTDPSTAPSLRVSPACADRAARVMEMLIQRWEAVGGSVVIGSAGSEGPSTTVFALGADGFGIEIAEHIDETQPVTSAARLTGKLWLMITGDESQQFRRRWSETKTQRFDRMMPALITTLMRAIEVRRLQRLDVECVKRQEEATRRVRKERADRESSEFYWRQSLTLLTNRWHEAKRMREFLTALQAAATAGQFVPNDIALFHKWFDFAVWYANSIDPILDGDLPGEPSCKPMNIPVSEMDLTAKTRDALTRLGITDTDHLAQQTEEQVRAAAKGPFGPVWNEITRILESLGYEVGKRREAGWW